MAQVQQTEEFVVSQETNTVNVESNDVQAPVVWAPSLEPKVTEGSMMNVVNELTDRWNFVDSFEWKISDVFGSELCSKALPLEIRNYSQQNWQVFRAYQFYHFDLAFKLQVNASRFHVGQLQMGFGYHLDPNDALYLERTHVMVNSQRPHVIFQVGDSDNVELIIPYNSIVEFMNNRNVGYDNIENFARLYVKVLAPLNASTSMFKNVPCTLLYRFQNVHFHGLRPVSAQMMRYLGAAVEGMYNQFQKDWNRDKPTNPIKQVVIPHASSSWSSGTNDVDTANILRLDLSATTPHPGVSSEEMQVDFLKSIFSLIIRFQWNSNSKVIGILPCRPCKIKTNRLIPENIANQRLAHYYDSTLGTISSCFSYWRGSIEFRIDVVCGPFHTGRLLVAYIPGAKIDNLSVNMLMQAYHAIFDIRDKTRFTFVAPFICDRKWADVYRDEPNGRTFHNPTGYVYVMALNPLGLIDQVPKEVWLNIYVRGGSDFEVSVPCASNYGVAVDDQYLDNPNKRLIVNAQTIYIGRWHSFVNSTKYICRWGSLSDQVASCTQGVIGAIYKSDKPFKATVSGRIINFWFFVIPLDPSFGDYKYLVPFVTYNQASAYVRSEQNGAYDHTLAITYEEAGPYGPDLKTVHFESYGAEAQVDVREDSGFVASPLAPIKPCVQFNEQFHDLKTLCRRYQFYTDFKIQAKDIKIGTVLAKVPILPCGMPVNLSDSEEIAQMQNRVRSGVIPLIGSAYRFFRGGLRFKIVVSCKNNVLLQISHHSNERMFNAQVYRPMGKSMLDFVSSGYASYAQSTAINQIFEIEVPFYSPFDQILSGRYLSNQPLKSFEAMGSLSFAVLQHVAADDIYVQMYYSLADDGRFKCFQGFYPLIDKNEIPRPLTVIEECAVATAVQVNQEAGGMRVTRSGKKKVQASVEHLRNEESSLVDEERITLVDAQCEIEESNEVEAQGLFSGWIVSEEDQQSLRETKQKADTLIETMQDTVEKANVLVSSTPTMAKETYERLIEMAKSFGHTFYERVTDVLGQIAHIFINPTIQTIAIAVTSILVKAEILKVELFSRMSAWCSKVFKWNTTPTERIEESTEVKAQSVTFEQRDFVTAVSDLIGILGTSLSLKATEPGESRLKAWGNNVREMCSNLPAKANSAFVFVQRTIDLITKIWHWMLMSSTPEEALLAEFAMDSERLKEWANLSTELLAVENKTKVFSDPARMKELLACSIVARSLAIKVGISDIQDSKTTFIRTINTKLQALVDELHAECLSPMTKYEPLVFYVFGPPGCGKSRCLEGLGIEMLKEAKVYHYGPPTFVRNGTLEFWNGVKTQPICIFDDFGCTDTVMKNQLNDLFSLKTVTPFNPPIAELENKKILYNPKIVAIASNLGFPKSNEINDPGAVYRRRDVLLECQMHPSLSFLGVDRVDQMFAKIEEVEATMGMTVDKILEGYYHLQFRIAVDPASSDTPFGHWMSYEDTKKFLCRKFRAYDERERKNYAERLNQIDALFPPEDTTISSSMIQEIIESFDECQGLRSNHSDFMRSKQAQAQVIFQETAFLSDKGKIYYEEQCKIYSEKEKGAYPEPILKTNCIHNREFDVTLIHEGKVVLARESELEYDENGEIVFENCALGWAPFEPCSDFCCLQNHGYSLYLFIHLNGASIVRRMPQEKVPEYLRYCFYKKTVVKNIDWTPTDRIKKMWAACKSFAWRALKFLWDIKKWLFGAIAIFGVTCMFSSPSAIESPTLGTSGAYKATMVEPNLFNGTNPQMNASSDDRVYGRNGVNKLRNIRALRHKMKFGTRAQTGEFDLLAAYKNNFGFILCAKGTNISKQRFLGLCGTHLVITKHFWEIVKSSGVERITLEYGTAKVVKTIPVDVCEFSGLDESSVGVLTVKRSFLASFKDIRKHILSCDDFEYVPSVGMSVQYHAGLLNSITTPISVQDYCRVSGGEGYAPQNLELVFKYQPTAAGLCGSPLMVTNPTPKIIGVHVAGSASCGYAQPIWREMFEGLEMGTIIGEAQCEALIDAKPLVQVEHVQEIGMVPSALVPRLSEVSRIVPSRIHGLDFPVTMEPSVLSAKDLRWTHDRSPLYYGLQKHGKPLIALPWQSLQVALRDFSTKLNACPPLIQKSKLSWEDIVVGIPGVYKGLKMNTSEGYPLVLDRPTNAHDKRWLIDYEEKDGVRTFRRFHPMLYQMLNYNAELRSEGIVPLTIFSDTLKDCRLPKEKVLVPGKTRVFSCCPLEYTLAVKKEFGVFQMSFLNRMFFNENAIGVNCNSFAWTELVDYLGQASLENCIVGDYKAFGDTLQPEVVFGCFNLIQDWYYLHFKEPFSVEKDVMAYEAAHAKRIALNYLYQTVCGIPSGFPLTVEMNSMVNSIYMRVCWILIGKDNGVVATMRDFNRYVRIVTYGDDIIMSVTPGYEWFNFNSISKKLAEFNISFTSADKDRKIVPDYLPIEECTFLKRSFIQHPFRKNVWLGALPKQSIEESVNWVWKGNDPDAAIFEAARACLEGAFGHGPNYYEEVRNTMTNRIAIELHQQWHSNSWIELDQLVFDDKVVVSSWNGFSGEDEIFGTSE